MKKNDSAKQNESEHLHNLNNQLKRALADYQNLEKRTEEQRREWVLSGNRSLVSKLLPVLDNLFLAKTHINDEGLNLSIQKFLDVLSEEGVQRIEIKDKDFDPHLMECVSVGAGKENKVIKEVRPGFIMNDRVLRPAQVVVGSAKQNEAN